MNILPFRPHFRVALLALLLLQMFIFSEAAPSKTTSAHKSNSSSTSSGGNTQKIGVAAYVVDWQLPNTIVWDKLDHIYYSFAEPDDSGKLTGYTDANLKKIVSKAHSNKKTVSLTIGGWDGSKYFSDLVQDSKRPSFVKTIQSVYKQYNLDGIDIDWEYPNDPNGVACNKKNPADTANLLLLMSDLRTTLGDKAILTNAVAVTPFNDESGNPSKKLDPKWATTITALNLMVYDINGNWNNETGPNAPLSGMAPNNPSDTNGHTAVQAWNSAGIPKSQLVLGVPFYGHVDKVKSITKGSINSPIFSSNYQAKGGPADTESADPCPGAKKSYSGEYEWRELVAAKIPENQGGWTVYTDNVTETRYGYEASSDLFLSYDDASTITKKAQYAVSSGLSGVMMWSLEMDDDKHTLLTALSSGFKGSS